MKVITPDEAVAKLPPREQAITRLEDDPHFQEYTVKNVINIEPTSSTSGPRSGGFEVTFEEGMSLWVEAMGFAASLPAPLPGQVMRLYGKGMGYAVRGVVLQTGSGEVVYHYNTPSEEARKNAQDNIDRATAKRVEFEKTRADFNAWVTSLPPVFEARIERFRSVNEDWDWEFGPYERFSCTEALKIAAALPDADKIKAFAMASPSDQLAQVPTLAYEEHSGNTFQSACSLAFVYIKDPTSIPKWHGALCTLVGCKEYGCYSAYPDVA
jgi:hypothetical protein